MLAARITILAFLLCNFWHFTIAFPSWDAIGCYPPTPHLRSIADCYAAARLVSEAALGQPKPFLPAAFRSGDCLLLVQQGPYEPRVQSISPHLMSTYSPLWLNVRTVAENILQTCAANPHRHHGVQLGSQVTSTSRGGFPYHYIVSLNSAPHDMLHNVQLWTLQGAFGGTYHVYEGSAGSLPRNGASRSPLSGNTGSGTPRSPPSRGNMGGNQMRGNSARGAAGSSQPRSSVARNQGYGHNAHGTAGPSILRSIVGGQHEYGNDVPLSPGGSPPWINGAGNRVYGNNAQMVPEVSPPMSYMARYRQFVRGLPRASPPRNVGENGHHVHWSPGALPPMSNAVRNRQFVPEPPSASPPLASPPRNIAGENRLTVMGAWEASSPTKYQGGNIHKFLRASRQSPPGNNLSGSRDNVLPANTMGGNPMYGNNPHDAPAPPPPMYGMGGSLVYENLAHWAAGPFSSPGSASGDHSNRNAAPLVGGPRNRRVVSGRGWEAEQRAYSQGEMANRITSGEAWEQPQLPPRKKQKQDSEKPPPIPERTTLVYAPGTRVVTTLPSPFPKRWI